MSTVYAFIVNFNRLELPRRMADFIADSPGTIPVIVDNASTYPPLLKYYETCPHKVIRLDRNWGNCVLWHGPGNNQAILNEFGLDGHFIITDPDLDLTGIPKDWLHELEVGLEVDNPRAWKSGFSLKIDDLPPDVHHQQGMEWSRPIHGGRFYQASIDTTFCLCRTRKHDFAAIRTGPPYTARHMPWYYQTVEDLPADELYYLKSITPGKWNCFSGQLKKKLNIGDADDLGAKDA